MSLVIATKRNIQSAARRAGYIVKRRNLYTDDVDRIVNYFNIHKIDTVLDVGANKGEYAIALLEAGFAGRIYSFEALPDLHQELIALARTKPDRWHIAPCCAIANYEGEAEINVTAKSASSSLLMPSSLASKIEDTFKVVSRAIVDVKTLSVAIRELGIESTRLFLKLDIQGGEGAAISGAEDIMAVSRGSAVNFRTGFTTTVRRRCIRSTKTCELTATKYGIYSLAGGSRVPLDSSISTRSIFVLR